MFYLLCLKHASEYRRMYFQKYVNFTPFSSKLPPLVVGVLKFTIACLLSLQMLQTKFGKDYLSSLQEVIDWWWMTKAARRRTPTHCYKSPEWLRWPKIWMESVLFSIFKRDDHSFQTFNQFQCITQVLLSELDPYLLIPHSRAPIHYNTLD